MSTKKENRCCRDNPRVSAPDGVGQYNKKTILNQQGKAHFALFRKSQIKKMEKYLHLFKISKLHTHNHIPETNQWYSN